MFRLHSYLGQSSTRSTQVDSFASFASSVDFSVSCVICCVLCVVLCVSCIVSCVSCVVSRNISRRVSYTLFPCKNCGKSTVSLVNIMESTIAEDKIRIAYL